MIPMEILTLISSFGGVLTALGVKEIVMWFVKRKSNKRIADAEDTKLLTENGWELKKLEEIEVVL